MQTHASLNGTSPMSMPPSPPPDDEVEAMSHEPLAATAALRKLMDESRETRTRFERIENELADIRTKVANVDKSFIASTSGTALLFSQSFLAEMTDVSPIVRVVGVVLATVTTGALTAIVKGRSK